MTGTLCSAVGDSRVSLAPSDAADLAEGLCAAVERQDHEAVSALLQAGADPNTRDKAAHLALVLAASAGSLQMIQLLLGAGANPNGSDGRSRTALHEAAMSSVCEAEAARVVAVLLEAGADPDLPDDIQETSLMAGCYWSSPSVVRLLAARSRALDYQTPATQRAAVHYAAMRQDGNVMRALLFAGASPSLADDDKETPMIIATRSNSVGAATALLSAGCPVDNQGFMDYSALHWAVYGDRCEIVSKLLEHRASVNLPNSLDRTPLHIAASCNAVASTKLLLAAGAHTDSHDANGATPLYTATQAGYVGVVRLLLHANADPNLGPVGSPPLAVALQKGLSAIAEDLLAAGCSHAPYWQQGRTLTAGRGQDFFPTMAADKGRLAGIVAQLTQPRGLRALCRATIRARLARTSVVRTQITSLCLPPALQTYLSMDELAEGVSSPNSWGEPRRVQARGTSTSAPQTPPTQAPDASSLGESSSSAQQTSPPLAQSSENSAAGSAARGPKGEASADLPSSQAEAADNIYVEQTDNVCSLDQDFSDDSKNANSGTTFRYTADR